MSQGKVVQIIGAVVDVEFPRDQMPKVYDALILDEVGSTGEAGLTLEVQQQLGDGVVRFAVWAPNARHVEVFGDFNGWMPTPMHPQGHSVNHPCSSTYVVVVRATGWLRASTSVLFLDGTLGKASAMALSAS